MLLLAEQGFLPDVKGAFPPLASVGQAIAEYQMQVQSVYKMPVKMSAPGNGGLSTRGQDMA